jgi:hypothetical protein
MVIFDSLSLIFVTQAEIFSSELLALDKPEKTFH